MRIEDLDQARVVPGAADDILRTLASLGMEPDEPVLWQSQRHEAYRDALGRLRELGLSYDCSCTRRDLAQAGENVAGEGPIYPGYCRAGARHAGACAVRLRIVEGSVAFLDRVFGPQSLQIAQLGDPVIRRRDGIAAYQLAVVVDDDWQRVSRVVRGADLLQSSAWQILLQRGLGLATPDYLHVPLVVEPDGSKLAKSRRSVPLATLHPAQALHAALKLLKQCPPAELDHAPVGEQLRWAIANWNPDALQGIHLLALDSIR